MASSLEDDLTAELTEGYRQAGEDVGYWATRFVQALRRKGGLATAKRMLKPVSAGQRKGLDALLDAGRPDLTVEAVVLKEKYRSLFTAAELSVAADRLGAYGEEARVRHTARERLYPDELEPGRKYVEGARKQVRVNAYERSVLGRKACIKKHGVKCFACGMDFESIYGPIGKGFIHVHHLHPLKLTDGEYKLDPENDLRPVCPNCHAMLHRPATVMTIEELRSLLKNHGA